METHCAILTFFIQLFCFSNLSHPCQNDLDLVDALFIGNPDTILLTHNISIPEQLLVLLFRIVLHKVKYGKNI